MKKIFLYHFLFFSFLALSQNKYIEAKKMDSAFIEADDFIGIDSFNNYYYIKNDVLHKKTNASIIEYQNLQLGKIKKVDIMNSLKIIVFYEDFNTIVILDNQLNEIQKVVFSQLETPILVNATGIAGQNKLWVFTTLNQQIGLYDLVNNIYTNLSVPINENWNFYQTDYNHFYWLDKKNNWNSCSIFGTITSYPFTSNYGEIVTIDDKKVIFNYENKLIYWDLTTSLHFEITNVEKSFKKMFYKDQILSIFTNNSIINYKITIP